MDALVILVDFQRMDAAEPLFSTIYKMEITVIISD
jgi:hypothetical protein